MITGTIMMRRFDKAHEQDSNYNTLRLNAVSHVAKMNIIHKIQHLDVDVIMIGRHEQFICPARVGRHHLGGILTDLIR